jgi:hypothetical protein
MNNTGLHNPLGISRLCAKLEAQLAHAGYGVQLSSDFKLLDQVKLELRAARVGPMHDSEVCDFSNERAYWMRLVDSSGATVGMQAYRCDYVDTSLADWLPNYMIGVYMRREEIMMPGHPKPPRGSISWRLRGRLVYEGELWLAKVVKARNVFDSFTRLGMLLSVVKWNPDAIWGLASEQMARHGHVGRIGYTILERGFLRWQWASKDVDAVEYLAAIEHIAIEQMIEEMLTTELECRP